MGMTISQLGNNPRLTRLLEHAKLPMLTFGTYANRNRFECQMCDGTNQIDYGDDSYKVCGCGGVVGEGKAREQFGLPLTRDHEIEILIDIMSDKGIR